MKFSTKLISLIVIGLGGCMLQVEPLGVDLEHRPPERVIFYLQDFINIRDRDDVPRESRIPGKRLKNYECYKVRVLRDRKN